MSITTVKDSGLKIIDCQFIIFIIFTPEAM